MRPFATAILEMTAGNTEFVNEIDTWKSHSDRRSFAKSELPHAEIRGGTALHYACLVGSFDLMEDLIKAGAKWMKKDKDGRIPSDILKWGGSEEDVARFNKVCEDHGHVVEDSEKVEAKVNIDGAGDATGITSTGAQSSTGLENTVESESKEDEASDTSNSNSSDTSDESDTEQRSKIDDREFNLLLPTLRLFLTTQ